MSKRRQEDLSQLSMLELFRVEVENQTSLLTNGLLELERAPAAREPLETLMRAAHSMKGAARIVNLPAVAKIAHAMEDCFVAAQQTRLTLDQPRIDALLRGVDLLGQLSRRTDSDMAGWEATHGAEIDAFLRSMSELVSQPGRAARSAPEKPPPQHQRLSRPGQDTLAAREGPADAVTEGQTAAPGRPSLPAAAAEVESPRPKSRALVPPEAPLPVPAEPKADNPERVVRLNAENLNRLLGLAGESLVESRWLRPFSDSLQRLKRNQNELAYRLERLRQTFQEGGLADSDSERIKSQFNELFQRLTESQQFLAERMQELDLFDRRSAHLSHRLYLEVLRTRMRPFGDGVRRFPRMVRDLARSLGKEVKLEVAGENTQVDRDILERLETPLAHLLRNAVDHGCEGAHERVRAGKSAECTIRLEARHSAGMLLVTVADDGAGVPLERIREAITHKKLIMPAVAEKLTEPELLEFLFLPGFTLKETVTEISGRGVGLDIVQNLVKGLRGAIRVANQPGRGMRVQLQLPLTLSVLRALLVEVAGEPYAIPLTQIAHTLKLARGDIEALEGRHHFHFGEQQIGLLTAHQVFDCGEPRPHGHELPVIVLGERSGRYGLVVDRFLGERELVVQPLDARLGKVKDISAAALMEDGTPVLIVDTDDLLRSIESLVSSGPLGRVRRGGLDLAEGKPKRILAVDDSLTVRELVRKLLLRRGFLADVAVDGMDGWNAVRTGHYDMVITDVDMPRMDGIELATLIKKDPHLGSVPVLIVSYKDREEDRMRGLEAGADYYLTKGSFHDETLLQAVVDLIGEPDS